MALLGKANKRRARLLLHFAAFCGLPLLQVSAQSKITIDDSYEPVLRRNLQAIANDVWLVVDDLFEHSKPPVDLPIICYFVPVPPTESRTRLVLPITSLDNWHTPSKILIGITTHGPYYAQFVYQLGHELGHVMLDPRRTNGVIETIASALAYEVLDRMAYRWKTVVPFPYMAGYGPNFIQYRIDDEHQRLARLPGINTAVDRQDWGAVRRYLYNHRSEQDQFSQSEIISEHGRDIEALGAISLRANAIQWNKLTGLALACSNVPLSKQAEPFPINSFSPRCLAPLSGTLCAIGRGCIGMIP